MVAAVSPLPKRFSRRRDAAATDEVQRLHRWLEMNAYKLNALKIDSRHGCSQ